MRFPEKTRRIPRAQWAIPIPERNSGDPSLPNDTHPGMAYDDAEALLVSLGFQLQFRREGFAFGDVRFMRAGAPSYARPQIQALWAHPAGVVVHMKSGGLFDDADPASRRAVGSLYLDFQIDSGAFHGNHRKVMGHPALKGTGGTTPLMHGGNAHYRSLCIGSVGDRGLMEILEAAQQHARFLSFEHWVDNGRGLVSSQDVWFCPDPVREDYGLDREQMGKKYADQCQAAFERASLQMIPALVEKIRASAAYEALPKPERIRLGDHAWFRAEQTINYFLRTLEVAGICWPRPSDAKLLSTWAEMVADNGAVDDLSSPVVVREGVAGMHYANALLPCIGREGNAERFLDLVAHVDEGVLRRWVSVPDASGLTLMGQMLATAGDDSTSTSGGLSAISAPLVVMQQAVDILVDRLGVNALSLGSEALPLPAIFRHAIRPPDKNHAYHAGDFALAKQMGQLVEHAISRGVSPGPPGSPDDIGFLRARFRDWEGLGCLFSVLDQQHLDLAATPRSAASTRARL